MKYFLSYLCFFLFYIAVQAQSVNPNPNPLQKQVIKRGYGLFMHFGINTFNQTEWSDGTLPVSSYQPTALNCDQWIADAKEAGARHVVLTVKHHDGFCLWNSQYTDYDVAASPVKTDVVKAVADACKKYGVQFGIYYSLWDRHEPSYKAADKKEYIKYMKNQLTELLTNYGPVCELWFDGAWDRKAEDWDVSGLYELTKKLQPNCAFTFNHTIGVGQNAKGIGQPRNFKEGDVIRFYPVDFRTKDPNLVRSDDPKIYSYGTQSYYLPFEHTICLSDRWNWFQKKDIIAARPLDELEQLFYWCTSNDNVLLLNYPPDQTGQQRANERERLLELADRLGIRGGKKPLPKAKVNLAMGQPIIATSSAPEKPADKANDTDMESYWMAAEDKSSLEISFKKPQKVRQISLLEYADVKDLGDGFSSERSFRTTAFNVEAYIGSSWKTIHEGTTIGACLTFKLKNPVQAQKVKINILAATKPVGFYHISIE
ncbi:alpha-L-fucosidase [Pedobacter frigoris]|uniref:alpha-L-fucosidase n=1 Tax=Pedobacter frigoris TaxID=2571272 RepID=A0A4U1CL73_9SPHI|nr:alpha-L-fucosidase [Pedobacter frigoris]TKC08527.1 crotonobetainyl-CoA--carnitine CoA-transferase [Pedobacter frigoris]